MSVVIRAEMKSEIHPSIKISDPIKKIVPTKAEIALLEPFVGLTLECIHVPTTTKEFASAAAEIKAAGIVGFDTESRPTFVSGDVSEGPHVVQFALHDKAYLFQLHQAEGHPFLSELLQSEQLIKVGFGLIKTFASKASYNTLHEMQKNN